VRGGRIAKFRAPKAEGHYRRRGESYHDRSEAKASASGFPEENEHEGETGGGPPTKTSLNHQLSAGCREGVGEGRQTDLSPTGGIEKTEGKATRWKKNCQASIESGSRVNGRLLSYNKTVTKENESVRED